MFKSLKISYLFLAVVLGIALGMFIDKIFSVDNLRESITKFNDVLTLTDKYYVEDVDTQKLVVSAINGMLNQLDPHSVYISPDQLKQVEESFRGDFDGIGIEFQIVNDTLTVVSAISGGPSEALGILPGDRIMKIDDVSAIGISNDDVRKKLRGKAGTEVNVTIVRVGVPEPIEYNITRNKIPIYSVDTHFMIDDKSGYVSVSRFSETTFDELSDALNDLNKQSMKQLILDLRGNPGGYLNQAVKVTNLFIGENKKIVYTEGRRKEFDEEYFASNPAKFENIPLIILINRGSASASEIVSGAIQDWDRGLIVGETSFGKGLVQRQFDLPDNSALRLTISKYYTPSGRLIQRDYKNLKDKSEYYSELDSVNEKEGQNINHTAEQDTSLPKYKTSKGRIVYGGGGITPDYIVKDEYMSDFTRNLLRKNVFYTFILSFLDKNGSDIKNKYQNNLNYFSKDFQIADEILNNFIEYAKSKDVKFNKDEFNKDREYIIARLKAQIARNYWKNEGWYSVLLQTDHQFKKALTLFDEAKSLENLK